jgi:hypothetical protein
VTAPPKDLKFNIFGSLIGVRGTVGSWQAFHLGAEGKCRPADFIVPAELAEHELCEYLADLFHENATPRQNKAEQLI